jgi:hypothetical protein
MKTVFYVGKAYPHRAALERIKSQGYGLGLLHDDHNVIKNRDMFDHVVPLDFSSEDSFIASLRTLTDLPKIDGLLCSYENYIVFKSIAADILSLPAMSLEAARASTDKFMMRQRFLDYDPSITPRFVRVDSEASLLAFARSASYPLIMKPTNLVKSLLVNKCANEAELIRAYRDTIDRIDEVYERVGVSNRTPGIIVEEFISGKMCSVAGFTDQAGKVYLCDGIVSLTTAQEAGFDDNFISVRTISDEFPADLKERILTAATQGVKALSMVSSPAHIELIYNDSEVKLVEIGARIGGYRPFLYEQAYGLHLLDQELAIAIGEVPHLTAQRLRHAAMYELFPHGEQNFVRLDGAKDSSAYEYFHQVATPGQPIGPAKNGYKAAAIIGIADEDGESFANQVRNIENIRIISS